MARCEIPTKAFPPITPIQSTNSTYPPKFNHQNHKLVLILNPQSFHVIFLQPKAPWGESVWRSGPEDGGGRSRQLSRPRKRSVGEPLCGGALWEFCWGRFCGMIARAFCVFVCCLVVCWGWMDEMMYYRRWNMYISCRLYMSGLCYLSTFVYTDTDISVSFV